MAIEFAQITKAGSSGSSSDNSILEWEQPVNTYIGMSMGSLSEATETLTEEMATKFKTNKYNIIVSTVDLGANTITVNCYLEVINKINDSEDIILQYSGNDSSGKAKVYFTIDTANLQVKYYLEQGGSSGSSNVFEASTEFAQFLLTLEAGNDYDVSNTIVEEINNIPINTIAISVNATPLGINMVVPVFVTTISIGNDWNEFSILGKLNLKLLWTNFTAIFMYDEPTNRYHCVCTQ